MHMRGEPYHNTYALSRSLAEPRHSWRARGLGVEGPPACLRMTPSPWRVGMQGASQHDWDALQQSG